MNFLSALVSAALRVLRARVLGGAPPEVHFTPPISRGRLRVGPDGKVLPGELALCGHLEPEEAARTRDLGKITCLACAYSVAHDRGVWERATARLQASPQEPR